MGWPRQWVFVRHAESEGNVRTQAELARYPLATNNYPLTERGRKQAHITGEWLHNRFGQFDIYYTSQYTRSKETMKIMYPAARVCEDARLNEVQRGIWHVLTKEEIHEKYPEEIIRREREGRYHYRPLGGESWVDVELRAHSFFGTAARDYENQTLLVVCHGTWLVLARKLIHHFSITETLREFEENHSANASVTIYRGVEKDDRPHLELEEYNIIPWKGKL